MGVKESTIVGSTLLAICFLVGSPVRAMEPAQSGGPASPSATLPSFLDDARLPALEEAWRTLEQGPDKAPQQQRGEEALKNNAPAAEDPMAAARAATESAKEDESVRQRAEELSRRFGAGGETSAPAAEQPSPSVIIPPAAMPPAVVPEAPRAEQKAAPKQAAMPPGKPAMPTRKAVMPRVDVDTTGAVSPPAEAPEVSKSAFVDEKLRLAAPPPPPENVPPLPKRAPKVRSATAAVPGTATKAEITRVKPAVSKPAVSKPAAAPKPAASYNPTQPPPDPKAALRGTVLTNELRAFGWDSQPK